MAIRITWLALTVQLLLAALADPGATSRAVQSKAVEDIRTEQTAT